MLIKNETKIIRILEIIQIKCFKFRGDFFFFVQAFENLQKSASTIFMHFRRLRYISEQNLNVSHKNKTVERVTAKRTVFNLFFWTSQVT